MILKNIVGTKDKRVSMNQPETSVPENRNQTV